MKVIVALLIVIHPRQPVNVILRKVFIHLMIHFGDIAFKGCLISLQKDWMSVSSSPAATLCPLFPVENNWYECLFSDGCYTVMRCPAFIK